ncbi:MAG: hypothetical protein M3Z05_01415 [Gemmatimonadota bacterium]|nr:hypothetical protein [Gemmatimonadota bacterium]
MKLDFSKRDPISGQIAFGLAPAANLDGAVAWLIRDANAPDPVLVVLSKESTNDILYVITKHVMRRDLIEFPVPDGRRVVKIFRDKHVVIEEAGLSRTAYLDVTVGSTTTHIGPELLRREANARCAQVAGVGAVHVVFEPTLNMTGQFAPRARGGRILRLRPLKRRETRRAQRVTLLNTTTVGSR